MVERSGVEHGAGADGFQRSAFSHRLGAVRGLRLFSDHARPCNGARCARRAGCIWRRRMPARFVCSRSSRHWRRAPEAGTSARCASSTELAPLFWLALVGFGVKAGFFPLHIWLPSAHANAPSHVSAIMSGVAIKMGHLRHRALQRLAAGAGGGGLGGDRARRDERAARHRLRVCAKRFQTAARVLLGGKYRRHPDRRRRRVARGRRTETRPGAGWRSPERCCMCGITARSSRCCSSVPARCCTRRARGK